MKRAALKITAIIMALALAFAFAACGSKAETAKPAKKEKPDNGVLATLFFASDFQQADGWDEPGETLIDILRVAREDGKDIDEVIMCGDYSNNPVLHDYQISPDDAIDQIRLIVEEECEGLTDDDMIFVQGNHDRMTDSISASGLHEFDEYLVYVLNTEDDFPWKQGREPGSLDKIKKTASEMKACFDELIASRDKRPVFIATHVPLHFSGRTSSLHTTGDNMYSSALFDVINEAGKDLDIFFTFGHNHSKGWDCYLGESCIYMTVGDEILIPEYSEGAANSNTYKVEKLNFTYFNAGYIGYCMNTSPVADDTLTATVCEIYADKIVLTRYSEDGEYQIESEGTANPFFDDTNLIPEEYYSEEGDSPQTIQ